MAESSKPNPVDVLVGLINPVSPPISYDEAMKASHHLCKSFPTVQRGKIDPVIPSQDHGIISFILPPIGTPRGKVAGLFKIRGNYPSDEQAKIAMIKILTKFDSIHTMYSPKVGHWGFITDDDNAASETVDEIDMSKAGQEELDAEAIALMSRHDELKKEKEEKDIQEVKETEKNLLEDVKPRSAAEQHKEDQSLDKYCELRVKIGALQHHIDNWHKTKRDIQHKIRETRMNIEALDLIHPDYTDRYIKKIRDAKAKAGIMGTEDEDLNFGV
jgi:hypothetical protein